MSIPNLLRAAALGVVAALLFTGARPAAAGDGEQPGAILAPRSIGSIEEDPDAPSAQLFWRASAETFVQYDDNNAWGYDNGGCIHRTGGSSWFDLDLQLPHGAEIDFLRVFYYDNDATHDATVELFSYDAAGGNIELASASSSGTPGWSSTGSGFFSHFVDTANEALAVRIGFGAATTANLRICGVRIRYQTP